MKVVETYDGSGCSKHLGNGFMKSQSFSFSPMPLDFIRPPPAPVFNPTPEEFTDPISYVQRISPIAFNYGICKIRPPNGWKPPFCVDQQNFTFVPRVQELSDVCAYNRVRYHFITSLINFWEAQDVTLFVPQIKGRSINIYRLWKQVQSAGGYQTVCEKKLWCKICGEIGLPAVPSFASSLSSHYKKYLLPHDTFIADESVNGNEHLEFSCSSQSRKNKPPVEKMVCSVCNLGNDDKYLLLCDGCETYGACHTYCLDPPLSDVPKGNWYCRSCIIRRYKRLNRYEVFGFKSSNVKYTLHTFGIRADDFKAKHFGKPTHMVSLEEAEAEFWRLVGSEDTGVSVEYGADLNAREHGSGFPTSRQGRTSQKSKNYATSPWNLNNTPLLDNSALRFLPRNISGMIIPWCYVGMAFSCFCWHTEDHWSYSINYLHMGEPKTWYGVPTNYADAFELAMRSEVPELFVNSPDLLHHMTTMVSPSRLQAHGVPVYRTDQMVGEFVVTFPRAFHAGFNQGFNFAEAVNFCPADWLEFGRNCIEHYALLHRTPVFSHAELLCRMAKSVEPLSVEFLTVITKQLGDLLTTERSLRRHLARIGVRLTERMVFENSEDEKRECDLCRTTLYLSSLGCKCSESMVCLAHYQIRTCCPRDSQIMRYRYDLDELTEFKEKLQSKLIEFEQWKNQIENKVFSAMQNPVDTVKLSSALKTATTTNTTTEINHNKSEELKQNTNQTVHNILHTSTSSRSSSETDDEVSIEDSRNSTATSFTKNSRRLSSSFHGDDDDNDDYTERLEQREEDKTAVNNQNEQVNVSLRANYCNNNSDNSNNNNNNNSCRKLRSRSTSCHYASSNRTRNKSSASKGPFISKLTLNEFASLVKLASTLPVILPEYKDLQELADHITRWRSEVRDLLVNLNKKPFLNNNNKGNDNVDVNDDCIISSSISDINTTTATTTNDSSSLCDLFKIELQLRSVLPSVIKVVEYINVGSAIDIELPELNQLKRVHECLTWLEKVDKALNYKSNSVHEKIEKNITITSKPTLSNLCDLQIQGSHVASAIAYVMNIPENAYSSYNFSSHSLLDTVLSIQSRHLLETISTVKLVEEKLNEIIQAKPGSLSLNAVKEQLIIAKQLPIQLTAITNVQLICEKAEKYEKQFELFAKLLLRNVSLSPSSLNEYNRNTFKQEQCCYTEGKQNKEEKEEANTADNNGINQCTMDQEILDEVGLGSVNSTPVNWQSYFNTLEDNIQDCVIKFPQNDSIRKLLSDLNRFHEKLSKLFIRPQSTRSLLEILLPRSASALEWLIRLDGDPDIIPDSYRNNFNLDANNCPPTTYKRHTRSPHFQSLTYKSLCKDHVQEFAKISNVSDWEQMYNSTYNRFVEAEVSLMHYLRSTNMRKSRAKNQEKIVYCICRQPGLTSFMLQCELCRDWVHGRCVTLPALKDSETERMRYICPRCECSLRPDLKQVLNFVSELNNLFSCNNDSNHDQTANSNDNEHERSLCFHQFPEFVAVQLLCYRAISFIKHIQKSIASNTELKQALSDYEHFSNMTMPSINLIEENISEELMSSSNCIDTSQIPTNSKKLYLPAKGTSPLDLASSSKSSLGSDRRSSNTTVRSMISHSQDYLDTDFAKTQTVGSYLPTSRPRAGNISMPAKSPWKMEMSANRNPREFIVPDEMRSSSSSSSRLSNLELQFSSYKQGFKSQSLGSDSTVCTHSGELKETEAAEALAGLSASLNSQSSVVQKQDLSLSSVYNRHSYINKLHHGPLLSPNHTRDLCNVNRLGQSKIPTTDLETTRKTSCLQSTRKFYFPLSAEARKILENLIMEACLLEVHLPQTRWLWQLHLASDQETESCGAYHPFVAKIEEERLKRRILRHIQQSNQSKLSERLRAGRRKRRGSGSVGNFVNVLNKNMEHSDDSNISLTGNSELQKRQRHSPIYSEAEEKQSGSSSVSDPITHPTLIPRRKACRLRGRASDLTIARRYKMGRPRRLLPVRSRRSVQRPSHAIGYRSMRSTEQKHFYNSTMRNMLQQKCHTMLSNSKQCKMPTNRRARNLSGQLCMASRRTGRVYRGERLVRRPHAFSNNEYSDSSTSEEHLETTPTNEQYHSRHESIPYRKMTSGYFSYSVGRKRSAFRHARLSGTRSTMVATKTILNNDESEDENVDCATDDQASNYEDDECPAGPCLHPQTGTVKWVQCEACCRWYHQICVGIHHHFQYIFVLHAINVLLTISLRLPSERFPDKHPSKLHLRTKATAGSPLKLGSHLSQRPVGWTTKSAVLSPRLPKLRPYNEKDVNSTMNQDIPVLTSQLVDGNWCDTSQSSEEPSIKIPVRSPRESVHMDEPPVIDAYEHVPNNYTNDEDAVEVSKGPTEVLLEALDVMSSENHFK
ncbi:putative jumonji/arid domain-containing protein [Schistosoma mansoni]|uniref:putative jumonji/arid domain-containing protein n=1 Tax=Schistosoma mansoni TaxID=6183 RepID=UPI00022DBF0A|nr:putative jumonji/arid domain-containing protein [Schistosoma mansoni]|eukprot:XP_018651207.1 putative jumonji/arid domain-containing protein [Schistosoma mansoni]